MGLEPVLGGNWRIFGFLATFDAKLAYIGLYLTIFQFDQLRLPDAPGVTTSRVNF